MLWFLITPFSGKKLDCYPSIYDYTMLQHCDTMALFCVNEKGMCKKDPNCNTVQLHMEEATVRS